MYCSNCGNKVHENAHVCVKCGVLLKKEDIATINMLRKKKCNGNASGIASIVFASFALLFILNCFSTDISEIGMYIELSDRIFYGIELTFFSIVFFVVSFILALVNKKKTSNKIGLSLSLFSLFLIITEFVVVMIY